MAVTSTLTMVSITVKLELPLMLKLQDFLLSTMKFEQLSKNIVDFGTALSTDIMEADVNRCGRIRDTDNFSLFYCDENYFKGTFIKLIIYDQLTNTLLVYFR